MIWLASYPKSGNTWLRLLIREYFKHDRQAAPFETKDNASYWYQAVSPKPLSICTPDDAACLRGAAMMNLTLALRSYTKVHPTTVIKTHMVNATYGGLPFFHPIWCKKAVYIHRDPRDIVPSLADHLGLSHEDAVTILNNPTAEIGEPPRVPAILSTWSNHVRSWAGGENDQEVLVVSYEEMHAATASVLSRVLKFYGFDPSQAAIKHAVAACRFDKLQREQEDFVEKSESQKNFFRRGVVGSHKDEVDPELVRQVEKDHKDVMKALGYLDG